MTYIEDVTWDEVKTQISTDKVMLQDVLERVKEHHLTFLKQWYALGASNAAVGTALGADAADIAAAMEVFQAMAELYDCANGAVTATDNRFDRMRQF